MTMRRSSGSGEDFRDNFGTSWDVIGSNVTDRFFNYEGFTLSLQRKLTNRAADRIAVDLAGLNLENGAQVRSFISALPAS